MYVGMSLVDVRISSNSSLHTSVCLQAGVHKVGVEVHRIELKQVGLPRQMQRSMAGEAEARVQAQAKLVTFQGETEANNRLVEAGGSLVSNLIP